MKCFHTIHGWSTELPARRCCGCKKQLGKTIITEWKLDSRWVCQRTTTVHSRSETRLVGLLFWTSTDVLTSVVPLLLFKMNHHSNALSLFKRESMTLVSTHLLIDMPCTVGQLFKLISYSFLNFQLLLLSAAPSNREFLSLSPYVIQSLHFSTPAALLAACSLEMPL